MSSGPHRCPLLLLSHLPCTTSTSFSSFTLPSTTTPEPAQAGQHDLLQEHPVHHELHQNDQSKSIDVKNHSVVKIRSGGNPRNTLCKGGQVGRSLRSVYKDLGIPLKIEIQSDSSTANSLTDRLVAGQRMKHTDTRRVQDGDRSIKKVLTAKNCADVGTKPVSAFSATTTLQVCSIGILLTMDPTLHYKMKGTAAPAHTQ